MKNLAFTLPLAALAFCLAATAQQSNPHNGKWKVTWEGARRPQQAVLTVAEGGGTWKAFASSRNDPCVGREAPITVQSATADELVFEVNASKALTGCPDSLVSLQREDDQTLKGHRGSVTLTAVRE